MVAPRCLRYGSQIQTGSGEEIRSNATTFTVDPGDSSESTHLTITTELVARPGISGVLERLLSSLMLRRVYRKEIARLAEYVAQQRVG